MKFDPKEIKKLRYKKMNRRPRRSRGRMSLEARKKNEKQTKYWEYIKLGQKR